jgi:hypothetical protein
VWYDSTNDEAKEHDMAITPRTEVKVYPGTYNATVLRRHNTHHSLIPQKSCPICKRHANAWIVIGF